MNFERKFATEVVKKLQNAGFEALFAGGCVRDELLGGETKDYDVATSALPAEVQKIFSRTVPVGEAFNVILVLSEGEKPVSIEVATFRKDVGFADGRRPQKVERATAKEDVERRDFTINGMLYNPIEDKIFDWVNGNEDLQKKIIRSIGEPRLRIDEDHLRMLRAIRFSSRFEFEIEETLWKAIQEKSPLITKISPERIFDELNKMLTGRNVHLAFERLADSGLLEQIMPEALAMKGVEQPPEYHPEGDVWVHTMLLLKQLKNAPAGLAWGCLLHDIGKPPTFSHEPPDRIRFNKHAQVGRDMARDILKRLRAPNKLIELVCELTNDHLKFADVKNMREATLKRFLRNPNFPIHLEMHRIDCSASHENLELYEFCKKELQKLGEEKLRPKPLITGHDLIALGLKPSVQFKEILEEVETQQLEDNLSSQEEAIDFVKKKWLSS